MQDVSAHLVVRQGPLLGAEFVLTKERNVIGRASDNDIAISDAEVSRQHAAIITQESGYAIKDLGSTNGTFVNGQRVVSLTLLTHGDLIELGEVVILEFLTSIPEDQPSPVESRPQTDTISSVPQSGPTSPADEIFQGEPYIMPSASGRSRRRWVLGCGCGCLLVVFLCMATLFFLDSYDQGRLLYCGPLQPMFELLLDPLGFSPACAVP